MRAARACACAALAGLLAVALVACRDGRPETVRLQVGSERFTAWVARTPEQRERGLMYRTEMGPRQGMLFVFEDERVLSFWMKNTPLPLSIAFLSAQGEILQIEPMTPFSELIVRSWRPARYALELNAGAFADAGAELGDMIGFPRDWR